MNEILDAIKHEQESRKTAAAKAIAERIALEQGKGHLAETIQSFMPTWWGSNTGHGNTDAAAKLRWRTDDSVTFLGYSIGTDLFDRKAAARYTVKRHTLTGGSSMGQYGDAIAAVVCLVRHLLPHATAHWIDVLQGMNCKEELKA